MKQAEESKTGPSFKMYVLSLMNCVELRSVTPYARGVYLAKLMFYLKWNLYDGDERVGGRYSMFIPED